MRRLSILFALAAALPLQARLDWNKTLIEVEAAPGVAETRATYTFTNSGEKPVTIRDITTSCSCTVADLDKRVYAPGESGSIEVVFEHGQRSGQQQKTIAVVTDERDSPSYELELAVNIPELLKVTPQFLTWKLGSEGKPQVIRVQLNQKYAVRIVDVSPLGNNGSKDAFQVAPPNELGDGVYEISVRPIDTAQYVLVTMRVTGELPDGSQASVDFFLRVR